MSKASDFRKRPNTIKPPQRDIVKLAGYGSLAPFSAACGAGTAPQSTTVSLGIQTIAYGKPKTLLSDWEAATGSKGRGRIDR